MNRFYKILLPAVVAGLAVAGLSVASAHSANASEPGPYGTGVVGEPSCSLRTEHIAGDPTHLVYRYSGKNPPKTMWVTTGSDVLTHTFYAAGTLVGPASDWVEYPTRGTWLRTARMFEKCPDETGTTEVTTPTPFVPVPGECPEGQIVRFEFRKTSGPVLPSDHVHFTYVDSTGLTRTMGTTPNFENRFLFTGSEGPADGVFNTVRLLSVDTEGYVFVGFSCYQPPELEDVPLVPTTEAPPTITTNGTPTPAPTPVPTPTPVPKQPVSPPTPVVASGVPITG